MLKKITYKPTLNLSKFNNLDLDSETETEISEKDYFLKNTERELTDLDKQLSNKSDYSKLKDLITQLNKI